MILQPLPESQAKEEVKEYYQQIKKALNTKNLPLFFQYFGPFPELLGYITSQIVRNLQNPQFKNLVSDYFKQFVKSISLQIHKSPLILKWINEYRSLPEFYYFQEDLKNIFTVNIKMAFIFLSIREAIKGWAVASRKLPEQNKVYDKESREYKKEEMKMVFEITADIMHSFNEKTQNNDLKTNISNSLASRPPQALVKNLLPDYLSASKLDFDRIIHREEYIFFRIDCEKQILNSLDVFPNLIFCPINVVLGLTQKYPNYPEILYLLSEHFPTFVVQRMIFSGYLLF